MVIWGMIFDRWPRSYSGLHVIMFFCLLKKLYIFHYFLVSLHPSKSAKRTVISVHQIYITIKVSKNIVTISIKWNKKICRKNLFDQLSPAESRNFFFLKYKEQYKTKYIYFLWQNDLNFCLISLIQNKLNHLVQL